MSCGSICMASDTCTLVYLSTIPEKATTRTNSATGTSNIERSDSVINDDGMFTIVTVLPFCMQDAESMIIIIM